MFSGGAIHLHARNRSETRNQSRPIFLVSTFLCSINDLRINLLIKSAQEQWIDLWQDACSQAARTSIRDTCRKLHGRPLHGNGDSDIPQRTTTADAERSGASASDSWSGSVYKRDDAQRRPPTVYRQGPPGGTGPTSCSAAAPMAPPAAEGISFSRSATVSPYADASRSEAETSGGRSTPSGTAASNGGGQGPALHRPALRTPIAKRGGSRCDLAGGGDLPWRPTARTTGHRRGAGDGYSPWGVGTAQKKRKENPFSLAILQIGNWII
jgi:hypothetical protein